MVNDPLRWNYQNVHLAARLGDRLDDLLRSRVNEGGQNARHHFPMAFCQH